MKKYSEATTFSTTCQSILFHNIPILLEEYGYQAYDIDDKVLIYKNNIEYEDLFEIVPDEIYELLLSYTQSGNNGIRMKRIILNKIYNYLMEKQEKYKSYSPSLMSSIKIVITKMGVTGEIDPKYQTITNYKLRKYYDECFSLMCYLIQTEKILKYKEDIKGK